MMSDLSVKRREAEEKLANALHVVALAKWANGDRGKIIDFETLYKYKNINQNEPQLSNRIDECIEVLKGLKLVHVESPQRLRMQECVHSLKDVEEHLCQHLKAARKLGFLYSAGPEVDPLRETEEERTLRIRRNDISESQQFCFIMDNIDHDQEGVHLFLASASSSSDPSAGHYPIFVTPTITPPPSCSSSFVPDMMWSADNLDSPESLHEKTQAHLSTSSSSHCLSPLHPHCNAAGPRNKSPPRRQVVPDVALALSVLPCSSCGSVQSPEAVPVASLGPHVQALKEEMTQHRDAFIREAANPDTEIWEFSLRKSKQPCLAVVMVWPRHCEGPTFHRGCNMEVSLPTGSLCAERNVIGTALATNPGLRRADIRCIAVLSIGTPPSHQGQNPLDPCGACTEWLKKIAERSPDFRVVTFTDTTCEHAFVKSVGH